MSRLHRMFSSLQNPYNHFAKKASPLRECPEVIITKSGTVRRISLNRTKALNALTLPMIQAIVDNLQVWKKSDEAKVIVIDSVPSEKKVFCAGGDVRQLVETPEGKEKADEFFATEYSMNHLIGTLKKPVISLIDGICMGGGVGLSVHGGYRIATENSVFAMPETAIGFFPDVGGSFFLSRLDGELGTFLALTGARLKGHDVYSAGIATHFIPSHRLERLVTGLADSALTPLSLKSYLEAMSGEYEPFSLDPLRNAIDKAFSKNSISEISTALKEIEIDGNPKEQEFATKCLKDFAMYSPTSLEVTLQMLRLGKNLTFKQCLNMEYNLSSEFVKDHDFAEGVLAKLVEKRLPKWKASSAKNYFQGKKNLQFLSPTDFSEYPEKNGLPREKDIRSALSKGKSMNEIYTMYPKMGIKHFAEACLKRK